MTTARRKPRAEVVALLEDLLGAAKDGELIGVFIVYQRGRDDFDSCWTSGDLTRLLEETRLEMRKAQSDHADWRSQRLH